MNEAAPGQTGLCPVETYLSYVSPLVLRRLRGGAPVSLPDVEGVRGAVVLLDVERFSAFAERMSSRGGDGVEQLATRINDTFALMVEAIERHGGIAHSFPGDSVIALWLAEDRTVEEAVLLAARCSLELLDRHRDSELPLKAGLAVGELSLAHVGGVDGRLQMLLSGDPLDQMGRAEERSSRGRLIVSEAAWRMLAPHAVAAVEADGCFEVKSLRSSGDPAIAAPAAAAPPAAEAIVEAARAYLPAALLRQLDAGHSAWLGEFREVSTVFLQIRAAAGGDPLAGIHAAFRQAQSALHRHGGDVMRFAHDDKGLAVLAVFGLPPASSEDAAAHAVTAALEIQRAAPAHRFRCRVGIATGRVFCGTLGAPLRREYSVVGSTPNLAARLMQALDGGVFCDEPTMQAARAICRFASAGRLRPKGFPEPVEVYRAGDPDSQAENPRSFPAPAELVGRGRERQRLHAWIDDLPARLTGERSRASGEREAGPAPGTIAVLQGEAGIGKSTLVAEAIRRAHATGLDVASFACESVHSTGTYATWAKVLASLLRLEAADGPDARASLVTRALAEAGVADEMHPLVAPILDVPIAENATTREMGGSARRDSLLAILARLFSSLAERRRASGAGLLLVLEDVHWLDPASWELLDVVTRRLPPDLLAILLTMRAETTPLGGHWSGIVRGAATERIFVAPLSQAETRELGRRLLHADDLSQQLVQLTWDRTRGNPFFCEQLLSALAESGIVGVDAGVASLRIRHPEQAESLVPRSVAAVVTSRLDRLPAPVQLTLKAASVLGARFHIDVLGAIHPMQPEAETLVAHLAAATELGLVEEDEKSPGTRRFRHAITCDVAYGLLLASQRRQLHRETAEYLGRRGDSTVERALLFYHWRRSGDEVRALEHVDVAGAEAMRNGNYHAVAELYGYALQTLPGHAEVLAAPLEHGAPRREALWSGHLGEAQVAIGLHEVARPNLELCLEMLGEPAPGSLVALLAGIARESARQLLHRLMPRRFTGSRAAEARRLELAANTYEQLGFVYYSAAETMRGLYAALRILNLAELAGLPGLMARSCGVMSLTSSVIQLRRLGELYDRRAMRLARETDDANAQAYVGWVTGLRATGEARWDLVEMRVDPAVQLSIQAGDRRLQILSLQTLAWPAYARGNFERAIELAEEQLAIARESNNRLWEVWGLNGQSEAAVMTGDWDKAIRNGQRSLEILSEESDRAEEIRALGLLAFSLLRQSRSDEAVAVARRGLELMTKIELTSFTTYEGFAGVGEVLMEMAEETRARSRTLPTTMRRDLRRALDAFSRYAKRFPLGRPRLHVLRARMAVVSGRPAAALREFGRALRAADELGMPQEKGLALVAAARCEALDLPARRRRAEEATRLLGGGVALRRAQDVLQELGR